MSYPQLEARRTSIQALVIANRGLLFFARRLRDYQQSKLSAIAFSFNLLLLLTFTVISFGAINYALFKLEPSQFAVTVQPNFFLFLYYSFHLFIFGSINEIVPVAVYSQIVSMVEQGLAIVLLFILIGLFISVRSERYKEELDRTILETEDGGRGLRELIRTNYNLSDEEALNEIRQMRSNLMKLILWLSRDVA